MVSSYSLNIRVSVDIEIGRDAAVMLGTCGVGLGIQLNCIPRLD